VTYDKVQLRYFVNVAEFLGSIHGRGDILTCAGSMNSQKHTLHSRTNYLLATSIQFLLKSELKSEKQVHYIDLDLTKADSLENTLLTQFLETIFFVRTRAVYQLFALKSPYWLYIFFRVEVNSTEIRTNVTSTDKCAVCCFKI
jgi:hypothetical protein